MKPALLLLLLLLGGSGFGLIMMHLAWCLNVRKLERDLARLKAAADREPDA